jgi:hypothetical protein
MHTITTLVNLYVYVILHCLVGRSNDHLVIVDFQLVHKKGQFQYKLCILVRFFIMTGLSMRSFMSKELKIISTSYI